MQDRTTPLRVQRATQEGVLCEQAVEWCTNPRKLRLWSMRKGERGNKPEYDARWPL
jgi:hypothetical protein